MADRSAQPPYTHNLVILHAPNLQDVADFMIIRNMLLGQAPEIRTIILSIRKDVSAETLGLINELPTLIFSPTVVDVPPAVRGTRLVGQYKPKEEEMALLRAAGIPVPRAILLRSPDAIPAFDFGPLVVVKPHRGMQGRDVRLIRASELASYAATAITPASDGLLVQEWVDTGPRPTSYRVFSVLGETIYCMRSRTVASLALHQGELPPGGVMASSNGQQRTLDLVDDAEVIALGRKIHRALPQFPSLGIDIIRSEATGQLYALELNSRGFTWHLSSNYGKVHQVTNRLDYYNQFDALKVISRALIDVTLRLAR